MNLENIKEFVKNKHGNQKRKHGTPYYLHPFAVAEKLKEKGYGIDYQIVGLFHDLLEDTDATYEELIELSNKEIADVVRLLTKEDGYIIGEYFGRIENSEMARVVKLADRIHNLEESIYADKSFREKYIKETEKYFINLAKGTIFEKDLKIIIEKVVKIDSK